MSLPWWAYLVAAVVGLVVLLRLAQRSFRSSTRRELLDLLRDDRELKVVSESPDALVLEGASGATITMNLLPLYAQVAALGTKASLEQRQEVYRQAIAAAHDAASLGEGALSLERHGDRLLPRLVEPGFLAGQPAPLPHRLLDGVDLAVVYVIDSPASATFVNAGHLEELGLDAEALHARALANLRKRSPDLRAAIDQRALAVLKLQDSFDAARLLLLPDTLRDGEEVAAAIPDRDTLAVSPVPKDGDWSRLEKLARTPAGPPLYPHTLRVSRSGIRKAGP